MGAIRYLAAAAVLALATVSTAPCFAKEAVESRLASLGNAETYSLPSSDVAYAVAASWHATSYVKATTGFGRDALRSAPALSLDRRVPATQMTDRKGLTMIGMLSVVGELRYAFSRRDGMQPGDDGLNRVVRTLRDSVFGKRISILSESGRVAENDSYLVGLSFTH